MFHKLISCVLLTLVFSLHFDARAADLEVVSETRVNVLWMGPSIPDGEFRFDTPGMPSEVLAIGTVARGTAYPVRLPQTKITIKFRSPADVTQQVDKWTLSGEISWPHVQARDWILLLMPNADVKSGMKFSGILMPDDLASFPINSIAVVNGLSGKLVARFGEVISTIPEGMSLIFPYPILQQNGSTLSSFKAFFGNKSKNNIAPLFDGGIDAWAGSRTLVIAYTEEGQSSVRFIVDAPEAKPNPAP